MEMQDHVIYRVKIHHIFPTNWRKNMNFGGTEARNSVEWLLGMAELSQEEQAKVYRWKSFICFHYI